MKKVICIILTTVMCLSLCGCSQLIGRLPFAQYRPVSKGEQQRMLRHLEEKYGEDFVIERTQTLKSSGSLTRGVYVYPAGKEEESFFVVITPSGEFVDKYVLRVPEEKLQPIYEKWIQSVIPSAKVAIKLSMTSTEEVTYYPEQTLQQFITSAKNTISINVNIMLSESLVDSRNEIFELSQLFENQPIDGYSSFECRIGFLTEKAFVNIESGEYISIPLYFKPMNENDTIKEEAKDYVAVTYDIILFYENHTQTKYHILEDFKNNFKMKEEIQ